MTVAVIDASALVGALLDAGDEGRWAQELVGRCDRAAPHLVLAEASNVLRRATLVGEVTHEEASMAHAELLDLDIELFPFEPFGPRVWDMRHNLTAYDAWYVAIAEALGCELVTLDARLARAPGIECPVRTPSGRSP